jgi:hypothetical protein
MRSLGVTAVDFDACSESQQLADRAQEAGRIDLAIGSERL